MQLIQLFLPLYRNSGAPIPPESFAATREELMDHFGGMTAYTRTPATGLWQQQDGRTVRDDIVVVEVMAEALDEAWWRAYRRNLEQRFEQQELLVLAQEVRRL